jgi:hypothetical protein
MDNKFQEQLRNHRIAPTAKPWERIEAELNKGKKRSTFIIYTRWAAAASIALMVTAYANWNRLPVSSSVVDSKEKTEFPQKPVERIDTPSVSPQTAPQNNDNQLVAPQQQQPILKKSMQERQEQLATSIFLKEKNNQENNIIVKENNNIVLKNNEQSIAFLNNTIKNVSFNRVEKGLQLPEIPLAVKEEVRLNKKWKSYLNEEIAETSDSTFTEKALVMVDQKTRTFVQRAWKPVMREFIRLRKGF